MLIHERFLEAAQQYPDAAAIVFGEETRSYSELEKEVKRIAMWLSEQWPVSSVIALDMQKSPQMISMMLACLQAGLTYVPLDPSSPLERKKYILHDCVAKAVIVDNHTKVVWDSFANEDVSVITADQIDDFVIASKDHVLNDRRPQLGDLAYMLYTSGSTGNPKGVMISHQNAKAFVDWAFDYFDISCYDRVAVHAPLHFDLPVLDIFVGLGKGATLYPVPAKTVLFPQSFFSFLKDHHIQVLYAVPSALIALMNKSKLEQQPLTELRLLLYAGEAFAPQPLKRLSALLPSASIYNLYGPVETNVITACRIEAKHLDAGSIPIGKPIHNSKVLLIDEHHHVLNEQCREGELVVSGPSVCKGYLNLTEATQASRLTVHHEGEVLECYRTGDFGHWGEDGLIYFHGRKDALVKTRGYRVDLGDVESTILSHPEIEEAAVVSLPHEQFTNLLYACVVVCPGAAVAASEFIGYCSQKLPSYMVPHQFRFLDELPKTSTGKISRRSLQDRLMSEEAGNQLIGGGRG